MSTSYYSSHTPSGMGVLVGLSVLCTAGFMTLVSYANELPRPQEKIVDTTPAYHFAMEAKNITAKAAIVYDPQTHKILFSKNASSSLPLASLTKLMTAQTILSLTHENVPVSITAADIAPEGDWGLRPGDTWNLHDLLSYGLVASANDAMAAAAGVVGPHMIGEMNKEAEQLGLSQTYFLNSTGLDLDSETAGAYGSVYDVARLTAAFLKENRKLFETTAQSSVSMYSEGKTLHATSTDTPLLDIPGLIAAKTGYTDLAGGNLVAVVDVDIGHPLIIAVLGSTRDARFEDVRNLITAARESFEKK